MVGLVFVFCNLRRIIYIQNASKGHVASSLPYLRQESSPLNPYLSNLPCQPASSCFILSVKSIMAIGKPLTRIFIPVRKIPTKAVLIPTVERVTL